MIMKIFVMLKINDYKLYKLGGLTFESQSFVETLQYFCMSMTNM